MHKTNISVTKLFPNLYSLSELKLGTKSETFFTIFFYINE